MARTLLATVEGDVFELRPPLPSDLDALDAHTWMANLLEAPFVCVAATDEKWPGGFTDAAVPETVLWLRSSAVAVWWREDGA